MQSGPVHVLQCDTTFNHARHYIAHAQDFAHRLHEHRSGHAAWLLAVTRDVGIALTVDRTCDEVDRRSERRLHRAKNAPKVCPRCAGSKARPFVPLSAHRAKSRQ